MEQSGPWNKARAQALFERLAGKENCPLKKVLAPFFVALTGQRVSLPLYDSMELLGRDLCVRRIQYALEALEQKGYALSKKRLKALSEDYARRY